MQFCTVSSREYVPFARALASCLRRHEPDALLTTLLVDDLDHEVVDENEPFRCLRNDELGIEKDELHRLYLIHGGQILPAIKPFFLEHLLDETGEPVLYIDSDIATYSSLGDLAELIEHHGVLLTPHCRSPFPLDGMHPDDTTILSAGTFNAGVIGVGERGRPFLQFLKSRLRRECLVDPMRMRVNEQRWLDLVPSYFPCHVLRDPGVNAAYWNLHERPLRRVGDEIFAGEAPLRAFHFSGYDLEVPGQLSRHAQHLPRIALDEQPLVAELCEAYRQAVMDAGFARYKGIAMPFDELPGGLAVDPTLRAVYRAAVISCEAQGLSYPPDGYDVSERERFLAWVTLTYRHAGIAVPDWAPSPLDSTSHPPMVAVPSPRTESPPSTAESTGDLVRRLAQTSAAALANLDRRLSELEHAVYERPETDAERTGALSAR